MKRNHYLIVGLSMFFLLLLASITNEMYVPEKKLESIEEIFYGPEVNNLKVTDVFSLIFAGATSTLLIILAVSALAFIIGVPLGLSAYTKEGLRHLFVRFLYSLTSRVPTILLAILLINLPFLIFSPVRYYWMIVIVALLGVGRISHFTQEKSHLAAQSDFAISGRNRGYRGLHFIVRIILPSIIASLVVNFFKEMGKVTILIGQLAIISIFFTQSYIHEGMGFGRLDMTGYNWTTMLGGTKEIVKSSPWIPIIPAFAFLYATLMFHFISLGARQLFYQKTVPIVGRSYYEA